MESAEQSGGGVEPGERSFRCAEESKRKLRSLLESLTDARHLEAITTSVNAHPGTPAQEFFLFLLHLSSHAIPALCQLLGTLKRKSHRLAVCNALAVLAKEKSDVLAKGLTDSRWYYVRNLVYIIGKIGNPNHAAVVEPLATHPDPRVRREAMRTLGMLRAAGQAPLPGKGHALVAVLGDSDETIRLSALNLLNAGSYRMPFSVWAPIVTSPTFLMRSNSEMQLTFGVMAKLVGEEAVPYLRSLVTRRLWFNRKRKQEVGALAAEALASLATPGAVAALEAGQKRANRVIRHACLAALTALHAKSGVKG